MRNIDIKSIDWKKLAIDLAVDFAAGLLIAVGIYNFAMSASFPVAGFSGIAIIINHLLGVPIGLGTFLLNIPVALFCYRFLGKRFFFRSLKTIVISSVIIDKVAPLLPVYSGDRLLAALCMGVLCGIGYALIFMRGSSTGGQDFITLSIRKVRPHMTMGSLNFGLDILVLAIGSLLVFHEMDGFIYGLIVSFLMSRVMDYFLYGTHEGKMALIVTNHGQKMAGLIDERLGRGSTILPAEGSYSGNYKDIVLCACSRRQMYQIKQLVKEEDKEAFTIMLDASEVLGEGFSSAF